MKKKTLLIVLDGYGEGKDYEFNAVTRADTPFLDELRESYPTTLLNADSGYVGLPPKTMGGSEVGHFTLGAGRIVFQSLEEINRSIKSGKFFKLPDLKKLRKKSDTLHIMGMISDEGVHSHLDHLFTLLKFAKQEKFERVYLHAFTDGRDVPERSADKFLKKIGTKVKIATMVGRFFAMDRDTNLKRTKKAFDLLTKGKGRSEKSAQTAVKNEYKRGTDTDYYIEPIVLDKEGIIKKEDAIVFFNYRTDRAKQLTEMFAKGGYKNFVCFGPYSKKYPVLFEANKVKNNLGTFLSKKGKKQLRVAETEKYAHVTFFFNSQDKEPYKGEKRILVPSPKCVSYAEKPEMSAKKITKKLLAELPKNHDFILINFANGDLVGHSGEFEATIKAVETLDECLEKIVPNALDEGYDIFITADHGNADFMKYKNGDDCPAHSLNPVIFIAVTQTPVKLRKAKTLGLADVAPTIINALGMKQPREMTGKSLML